MGIYTKNHRNMFCFKRKRTIASFKNTGVCPIIKATLFDKDILLLVDTGSDVCYLDKEFFDSIDYSGELAPSKSVMGSQGETASYGKVKTEVTIGNCSYELPITLYRLKDRFSVFSNNPDECPVGIIGGDFLFVYRIVIDYHHQTLSSYK